MLTQEKIVEIKNQLQGLSPEDQQKKLQEILETLSPEEREQLVGKRECPFCLMGEGKIPTKSVYEDDSIIAVLDINPATKGHILLFPKEHAGLLAQVPDKTVEHMFSIANKLATAAFEATDAAGTNIVVSNGTVAGQTSPHVLINIIPRFEDDKVSIDWNHTKVDESELEELAGKIKSSIPKPKPSEPVKQVVKEEENEDPRIP